MLEEHDGSKLLAAGSQKAERERQEEVRKIKSFKYMSPVSYFL